MSGYNACQLVPQSSLRRLLLEAKLDVTAKYNLSALMLAVIGGHTEVVQILAEYGSDLSIRGSKAVPGFYGKTALALTRDSGRIAIVQVLSAVDAPL